MLEPAENTIRGSSSGTSVQFCTVAINDDTLFASVVPNAPDSNPPPRLHTQAWAEPREDENTARAEPSCSSGDSASKPKIKHHVSSTSQKKQVGEGFRMPWLVMTRANSSADIGKPSTLAVRLNNILENNWLQGFMLLLTLMLLFCGDFVQAVGEVESDNIYSVMLYICLFAFFIEYVAQCTASSAQNPPYICSLFFFLDFIACMSVLLDIVVLEANNLTHGGPLARAARAAKIGTRAGRSLRLMRLMRFLRLVRVTRMVKMLLAARNGRMSIPDDDEDDELGPQYDNTLDMTRADTIGAQIGAATTKKVIIMTLILLIMTSVLERSHEFQRCGGEMVNSLEYIYKSNQFNSNCTSFQKDIGTWFLGDGGIAEWTKTSEEGLTQNGLFLAVIGNCQLYLDTDLVGADNSDPAMTYLAKKRRGTEIQAIPCDAEFADTDSDGVDERSGTYFLYDLRAEMKEEAWYSMGFTLVIVVSLLGFSLIFSNDAEGIANQLVVPIKQLMEDMSCTAKLQFDKVTPIEDVISSSVFEVRSLQVAYHNLNAAVRSFSKFTPLEVVRHFLSLNAVAQLGVVERTVSIFFSDIAGWTTICEGTPPVEVLALLSEYFENMVSIILEEQGTMLEFIGDAILAIWNAPNDVPDHAVRAISSATRMKTTLEKLRQDWSSQGRPAISIRVGLHSSKVWVGNLGSSLRMKYGVLGDGVNLASKLEELNKRFKTETMISEEVLRENDVSDLFLVRPLDIVEAKGCVDPKRVYEVLCPREKADEDTKQVATWSAQAMKAYLNRDFSQALESLGKIKELKGGADAAGEVLFDRCQDYLANAPPADWNGVEFRREKQD